MNIELSHGIPSTPFFLICVPKRQYKENIYTTPHQQVILTDPATKKITVTELWGVNTVYMKDFRHNDLLSFAAYGVDADTLQMNMEKKYPELKENHVVQFWLLKKI